MDEGYERFEDFAVVTEEFRLIEVTCCQVEVRQWDELSPSGQKNEQLWEVHPEKEDNERLWARKW